MRKIYILSVIIISLLLNACGSSMQSQTTNNTESSTEDLSIEKKFDISFTDEAIEYTPSEDFIDGYEMAIFNKFNSPASENGLGDTKIYVTGIIEEIKTYTTDENYDIYIGIIATSKEDKWASLLNSELYSTVDYYNSFIGHKVILCGIYTGFSNVESKPVFTLVQLFDTSTGDIKDGIGALLSTSNESTKANETFDTDPKPIESETVTTDPSSNITSGQMNALNQAKSYLNYSAFSYQGLIDQLIYEGYSVEDATYAVDNCGADWNTQALESAKSYLNYTAFSYSGLIDQLIYEHFSAEQATYAADNCGADWNDQAAKCAKSYLEYSSFSHDGLVDQLIYEGFTNDQAIYGVNANGL